MDLGELTLLEKNSSTINILYIFGFNYSLKTWFDSGSLDRETLFFNTVNKKENINYYLLTYGTSQDLKILNSPNIKVLPIFSKFKIKSKTLILLYSIFYPIFFYKNFKNIDLIKVNQLSGSWVGIILKLLIKKPLYIRTGYDAFLFSKLDKKPQYKQLLFKLLTKISLVYSDLYSVTSKSDFEFIVNNYNFDKSKLVLRRNWVVVSDNGDPDLFKNRYHKLISVGRLEDQKNYFLLIDAIKNTGIDLDIIGNGSLKLELQEYAKINNVNLKILGNLSNNETLNLLKKYKFFILPSKYEGNPKSLLEAMSSGCVVFASNIKNHYEIIDNNINGYLFDLESQNINLLLIDKLTLAKEKEYELVVNEALKTIKNEYLLNILVNYEVEDINKLLIRK